jgi:hypothetical protein
MRSTEKTIISKATNRPAAPATRGKILGPKPSNGLVGKDSCSVKRAHILDTLRPDRPRPSYRQQSSQYRDHTAEIRTGAPTCYHIVTG